MHSKMTLGMGQMLVVPGQVDQNLDRAVGMIGEAKGLGCDIVVLPECCDVGWTNADARRLAESIPGSRSERLAAMARKHRVAVVAGLTERASECVYNTAVMIDTQGDIRIRHRKINELPVGHDIYDVGDRLQVARCELGAVAVNICADNFPSSLAIGHVLARMGAQILLSPSAWAVPPGSDDPSYGSLWLDAYRQLTSLYDITVVGVSCVGPIISGPWSGYHCIGASIAMGPGGDVLARGPYGAGQSALIPVPVALRPPIGRGTTFAAELSKRGYVGP